LQLKIYSKCNTVIYSKEIGPFSSTADLGTITVDYAGMTSVTISGTVVNCNAGAVTNGFVDISIDSMHNRATITNGAFTTTITRCSNAPSSAYITAYDLGVNQSGLLTFVPINSTTVNAGQLSACGTSLARFVNYTLNGSNGGFVPPTDTLWLSPYNSMINVSAMRKNSNNTDNISLSFIATGTGTVPINYIFLNVNQKRYVQQSTINLNITEFGPIGTGYISGNFSGNLKEDSTTVVIPANLSFRMKR